MHAIKNILIYIYTGFKTFKKCLYYNMYKLNSYKDFKSEYISKITYIYIYIFVLIYSHRLRITSAPN